MTTDKMEIRISDLNRHCSITGRSILDGSLGPKNWSSIDIISPDEYIGAFI